MGSVLGPRPAARPGSGSENTSGCRSEDDQLGFHVCIAASKAMSGVTMKQTYITTSWDDGHQLDLRVAELLTKYRLHGTFYIPKAAENGTMKAAQVRELSRAFEIGAHTLHHVVLTSTTDQQAWQEII